MKARKRECAASGQPFFRVLAWLLCPTAFAACRPPSRLSVASATPFFPSLPHGCVSGALASSAIMCGVMSAPAAPAPPNLVRSNMGQVQARGMRHAAALTLLPAHAPPKSPSHLKTSVCILYLIHGCDVVLLHLGQGSCMLLFPSKSSQCIGMSRSYRGDCRKQAQARQGPSNITEITVKPDRCTQLRAWGGTSRLWANSQAGGRHSAAV